MKSADIRQAFFDYFVKNGHELVSSSSLVPSNDPTLLFTNAGMVQFKDVFLGREHRDYNTAVSSQRCVRAGGKHNDLDNVGYTARHHTFFEMLGNFSFGDYFKREAIQYAWDFLTSVLGLPPEKLWVTVYKDDDEAADIWLKEMKISSERFSRCDEDNFWSMGDVGPCGPCTEIFYDHGPNIAGGPPGSPEQDGDRYIEIWNLVFMQYDRSADGTLTPLPKPSVDTGMGLERLSAVLQNVHNNYDTDLFTPILKAAGEITGEKSLHHNSLRVIADHIRSSAFLIADGVVPGNEGRDYVLRRIIRRAARHGHHLGENQPFLYRLVAPLIEVMGQAYPELVANKTHIENALKTEETQFLRTLDQGMAILQDQLRTLSGKVIAGEVVFKLYDTYGFPADLTADIAREKGLGIDEAGFNALMAEQRARSQESGSFRADYHDIENVDACTTFVGYESLTQSSEVVSLLIDGKQVQHATEGDAVIVVLSSTPFYAESGGQVGDAGELGADNLSIMISDTQSQGETILHFGQVVKGSVKVGDTLFAEVGERARRATMANHSATHLLHAALRQVLGKHVQQKGSIVTPEKLRFDFSHNQAVSEQELSEIEHLVNRHIRLNHVVTTDIMTPKEAQNAGAMALFGEKYGDRVRVLSMGEFSKELCGGTHVARTGDIGLCKITLETSIASGVRRIEAVTGAGALQVIDEQAAVLREVALLLRSDKDKVTQKLLNLIERNRSLEKNIATLQKKLASGASGVQSEDVVKIDDVEVIARQIDAVDVKTLRATMDQLKQKFEKAVIVLSTVEEGKVRLVAGVTSKCTDRFHAGELVNFVAEQVGGKGGGRADMAQAGGDQPEHITKALNSVAKWVEAQIKN